MRIVLLVVVLVAAVNAVQFVSNHVLIEGGGSSPPIIAVAVGCTVTHNKAFEKVFLYEHAPKMIEEIAKAINDDGGVVALNGHGSPFSIEGCGANGDAADYHKFLAPFKGKAAIKHVISFGCKTGQGFVEELQKKLVADFAGVKVTGPLHIQLRDCSGKSQGRVFLDDKSIPAGTTAWKALSAPFFKNLGGKITDAFWVEQQAAEKEADAAKATKHARIMFSTLAMSYSKLWDSFIDECDKQKLLYKVGEGWTTYPGGFFFRQVLPQFKAARKSASARKQLEARL